MKIEIEISEFYLDDNNDLESGLKEFVSEKVKQEIWDSIQKRVEEQIERRVKEEVQQKLSSFINAKITELIATENIIIDKKSVAIADHIKTVFQSSYGWSNPTDVIKDLAKKFGTELKARYDLQFASHVVAKLNEQGMLKEDVAKMLIEPERK